MATNNKDFIVKNGIDVGQNASIAGSLTASGLSYPVSDGDPFMAITTDGAGNLSFANVDTVESDVTNQTGTLIPKGTPVYQTGAAGQTLTIAPSDASNAATMPAIGVAADDIADGSTGRVIHFGYIKGVDTSAFSEGSRIYVADGGGYQEGRPTGEGNIVQFLGVVTKVHATNGSGVVFGGGRAHAVPNLDDGNIFIGDNTNSPVTATLDTDLVPEGTNQYFTTARAISAIEGSTNLTIDGGTLYIDTSNNYIGINDTSPQQALDVTGAIAIGGTTVIDSGGEVVTAQLKDSGVTAGSYGSASLVPIITVDSKGRITSASTTSVAGVSNFTFNSTTDVLTISTADGGSYTSDISNITVGGSMDGPLANLTVKYQSTAPTSPSQGQIYFDSLNQLLMIYTGSGWVQTIPSSSGGGGTSGVTDAVATFQKYTYTLSSTTNAVSGASEQVVDAGDFTIGKSYQIRTVGDTDFTAIGASANTVGTVFVATGVGEGTGDAYTYLAYSTAGAQNVEVFVNGVKQVEGATNDYVATTGTAVTFTYNIPSGSVVDVQVYELLTQDAFYLKSETYTTTEVNSQISTAVSAYLPLTGGTLTGALSGTNATLSGGLTVDTNTLVVDNTNNRVGIGMTNPARPFHIDSGSSVNTPARFDASAREASYITFVDQATTAELYVRLGSVGDNLVFNAGNAERMRIDAAGKVGIGTTSPSAKLHVYTGTGTDFKVDQSTPNYTVLSNDRGLIMRSYGGYSVALDSASSVGNVDFRINGTSKLRLESDGTLNHADAGSGTAQFVINKDMGVGARNLRLWGSQDVSPWTSFIGTNIKPDGDGTFTKLSDNGSNNWGNASGIMFDGANSSTMVAMRFIVDNAGSIDGGTNSSLTLSDLRDRTAMAITAGGDLGINTTGSKQNNSNGDIGFWWNNTNGYFASASNGDVAGILNRQTSTGDILHFRYNGGVVGSVSVTSSGTTYNTTSDRRLKDNIVTITNGKEKLLAMNPVTHTWKADPNTGETVHGFIAQEMQHIVPEAVTGDPESDEMMSMDYGRITPVIVAALQDALKEIEELKERIKTLEAK